MVLLLHAVIFSGGGKEKVVITTASERVGGVASHMATTLDNGEDSDLAPYLPPVLSQPVVQIVQRMITGEEEPSCSYAGIVLLTRLGLCIFTVHVGNFTR